jgi:cadmium resistance protein CadD (predicted permease)
MISDIFISKWHLISVACTLIALIGLWLGKYDRKTIIKSGIISAVFFYLWITFPVAVYTFDDIRAHNRMVRELDKNYEKDLAREPRNIMTAAMGTFYDDGSDNISIYVGNYSSKSTFRGSMKMTMVDKDNQVVKELVFKDLVIEPGEKTRVAKTVSSVKIDKYNYQFFSTEQKK